MGKFPITGQIPSGLFLLTFFDNDGKTSLGTVVSWVQQISFDPIMICVALDRSRPVSHRLSSGKVFALHIVGIDDRKTLKSYIKDFGAALTGAQATRHATFPVPIIPNLNALVCTVMKQVTVGSHELVCATVDNEMQTRDYQPWIHIRASGLNY